LVQVLRLGRDLCAETDEPVAALFDEDQCKRCTIACQPALENRLDFCIKSRNHGVFLFCAAKTLTGTPVAWSSAVKEIVRTLFALQHLEEQRRGANGSAAVALRDKLPSHILERHEKRRARGQRTVAIAHNGTCGECHLKIPLAVEKALVLGADVQTCTNCGRFLILFSEGHSAPKKSAA